MTQFLTTSVSATAILPLVKRGSGPALIANNDFANTIWISNDFGVTANAGNAAPLPPQATIVVDGSTDIYAVTLPGQTVQVFVIPGGQNFFQLSKIRLGSSVILSPSGDTSGVTDANVIQSLLNAGFSLILSAGHFYVNTTITFSYGVYISGAGFGATIVSLTGAGGIPVFTISGPSTPSLTKGAGLSDLTVDTSLAIGASECIRITNIDSLRLNSVGCTDNSKTGGIGIHFLNNNGHSERAEVLAYFSALMRCVVFDVIGSDTSFDRGEFTFELEPATQGNGCEWINGAQQLGGSLKIRGNVNGNPVSNTGKVLAFSGAGSALNHVNFDVSIESDGAGVGPQTINFALGSNVINGYGIVDFLSAGSTFQNSNNAGNFTLDGRVFGDITLQTLIGSGDYTVITTGFPAGWTGSVRLEKTNSQDLVFVSVNLSIANTTVVTNGETILATSTIVSPLVPQSNQRLNFVLVPNAAPDITVPLIFGTGGNLIFQGAGFTATAVNTLSGTAVYSNSH